jgi:hypothetical protein
MNYYIALILLPMALGIPANKFGMVDDVSLVTFDGSESTTFKFTELDDPVMVSL